MSNEGNLKILLDLRGENARLRAALDLVQYKYDKAEDKSLYEDVLVAAGMLKKKKEIQLFCDNCRDIAYEE